MECESWTLKKAGCWRIVAFELWCCRRLLRVPWTAKRSNQSILKEISSEYSLEELMLKPKLQYLATWCEQLTPWKRPWCWERLKTGGEGDDKGWDGWMATPTQWTWVWGNSVTPWTTRLPCPSLFPGVAQIHVHWVTDALQPSHPLLPLLLFPTIFPSITVFSSELALHV